MFLQAYGLATAAGPHSADLWQALIAGVDCSKTIENSKACFWPTLPAPISPRGATLKRMLPQVKLAIDDLRSTLDPSLTTELTTRTSAVIFASTKGCVDDFVWEKAGDTTFDPFENILEETKKLLTHEFKISIERSLVISTACTSSLSAVAWAEKLLAQEIDFVFVVAADAIGPFVYQGFCALKALSEKKHMPFSAQRSGLQLGEAAGVLLLNKELYAGKGALPFEVSATAVDTEGNSITRPTLNGRSLARVLKNLNLTTPPDALIAHGTGTYLNDPAEDAAFDAYFSGSFPHLKNAERPPITATKWCVGHALGASGVVDIVAACEALKAQKLFRIANTSNVDETLKGNYLANDAKISLPEKLESLLITSIGFGGMHAAICLKKISPENVPAKKIRAMTTQPFGFRSWSEVVSLPLSENPAWIARVDRWSQLDAPAQVLCEAYTRKVSFLSGEVAASAQFLASDEGSNESDLDFVASAGLSPSKFVHTLPNIRCSPLLQLMEWNGPVFCFQSGQSLLASVLEEQFHALKWQALRGALWTWSIKSLLRGQKYRVTWCRLSEHLGAADHKIHCLEDLKNLSLAPNFV